MRNLTRILWHVVTFSLLASTASAMEIGTNYWVVSWGSGSADPFVNGYQNVSGADPWRPEFLLETAMYTVHRFMDWNRTNRSTVRHWSERNLQGNADQGVVAYEWMIDFCNRQQADIWITVPHLTFEDPTYWTQLAELLHRDLDLGLRVYIEYSNETWNGMFEQADYARAQGSSLGLDSNANAAGGKFHVYAAVRLFEAFEQVWGADSPRLVKVIAGHAANSWLTGVMLGALSDPAINPNGTTASAFAIAPYFGHGASSIGALGSDVPGAIDSVAEQASLVAGSGLSLIAYEGGQHVTSNADTVNRDPAMADHYAAYLAGIDDNLEVFAHYAHSGRFTSGGAWGAKERIGQDPAQAHKYRALVDYVTENPSTQPPPVPVEPPATEDPAADALVIETATAPTIDGEVDDVWSSAPPYSAGNLVIGVASTDTDLSASWRALWDAAALCLLVEVTDDILQSDSGDTYEDDSIELFIDADSSRGSFYDATNDYQLIVRWNDATLHTGLNSVANISGVQFVLSETATGYVVELLLPWTTLGVSPSVGSLFGIDVHVNDDDDGGARDAKRTFFGTQDRAWQSPSAFGTARLQGKDSGTDETPADSGPLAPEGSSEGGTDSSSTSTTYIDPVNGRAGCNVAGRTSLPALGVIATLMLLAWRSRRLVRLRRGSPRGVGVWERSSPASCCWSGVRALPRSPTCTRPSPMIRPRRWWCRGARTPRRPSQP